MKYFWFPLIFFLALNSFADKYDEAMQLAGMSKDVADQYRKAEKLRDEASVKFQSETGACHKKYRYGRSLEKCLDTALSRFQAQVEKVQDLISEEPPQKDPKTGKFLDGLVKEKDELGRNNLFTYVRGRKNGHFEEWDGDCKTSGKYRASKYEGKIEILCQYEDVTEKTIENYRNGKRVGNQEVYQNGVLIRTGQFKNDEAVGIWKEKVDGKWIRKRVEDDEDSARFPAAVTD